MTGLGSPDDFQSRVARARDEAGIPGLAFAASLNGSTMSAASGVLNVETGVEARPDSLFQIGSITKSLTATLVMQAADAGLLDIDAAVSQTLRLPIGRGEHCGRFTARQLLSHTSGLDGDLFLDSGRDDDALARYMVLCEQLEFLSPPGRHYNYCNAGYSILGRLLEIVRGKTYDQVLRDHLFAPLDARRSTSFAEEAVLRRTAVGHVTGEDGKPALAPLTLLPRALGPAGLTVYSTAEELVRFGNAHIAGETLLSRKSVESMRTPQVDLADGTSWGLGWKLINRGLSRFIGHEGGTVGQVASLCLAPERGLVVAMCTNGGRPGVAWEQVAKPLFREVCGEIPEVLLPEPASEPIDLSSFEGVYDNLGVSMQIAADADRLRVVAKHKFFSTPDTVFYMRPVGGDRFRATIGEDDRVITAFYDRGSDGRPELFYAGRIHRRTAT